MTVDPLHRTPPGFEQEWSGSSASATEVVLNLIRTGEELNARVDTLVRAHGLPSSTALIVLEVLRGESGPLQPSVIAERSFASRPALSGVMDTLERRGLLRRSVHPDDRRRSHVQITPAGLALLDALLPELHRAEVDWVEGLSQHQQTQLLRHLARLRQANSRANDATRSR